MKALKFRLFAYSLALATTLATPTAAAAAEGVVPPSNGGANQYTETYPTGGGNKNALTEGDDIAPGKVIGDRNAEKLEERGEEGEEVAELAAETSPATEVVVPQGGGSGGDSGTGGGDATAVGAKGGGGDSGGATGDPAKRQQAQPGAANGVAVPANTDVQGSGGFGEVISQIFGTSGSGMGALLPLLMLGAIAWAFLFAARQRRRVAD